ncbi:MAG: FAD-dependent oxidoreductase [Actinobacteria bacterium]|nr:FAD-dependent oxidoreductase [Actinomycetota bacterium]
MTQSLPGRARVVIVGGGIIGASTAYHLVKRGWTDIVLLERKHLTSGTTWHAAGGIVQARGTQGTRRMVQEGLEIFHELERSTGIGLAQPGTIHLATTPDRMIELTRVADAVSVDGIEARRLTPDEVHELHPYVAPDGLVGGTWWPLDGKATASDTTLAMAKHVKERGGRVFENVRVERVLVRDGAVCGVSTDLGDIEAEYVVNATGMWGNFFGREHGLTLPLQAMEHYYVVTEPIDGLPAGLPTIKTSDDCSYVKADAGALLVGFFEPGGRPWEPHGIPDTAEFASLPGEWDHVMPWFERMVERMPVLADAGIRLWFCGPESFTPDGQCHLGLVPGLRNYFAAVGMNSVGFLSGPGAGKYIGDWIVDGRPAFDLTEADPRRSWPFQTTRRYLGERVAETLDRSYSAIHYPFEQRESARGLRRSPLHEQVKAAGAVFGEVAGWERANWYARADVPREYVHTYGKPQWFDCWETEHRAAREAVALFDLSSFGKIRVAGPGSGEFLQRVCTNNIGRADNGRIVYTQSLNDRGGIELDVTVLRTDPDRYLVLTAASTVRRDIDWLERCLEPGESVVIDDVSNSMAMLPVMGPRSKELLARLTDADLSLQAFPFGTSKEIDLGQVIVRASRISYVGEVGWELLVPTDMAAYVYEQLTAAGQDLGLEHAGYHALNSLRLEKGFRSWGHDIGPDDSPLEAGLAHAIAWATEFIGKEALLRQKETGLRRRHIHLKLVDPQHLAHHDEPVLRDGNIVGKITSGAFGFTVGSTVAIASVGSGDQAATDDWILSGQYEVVVQGIRVAAVASLDAFYDPAFSRPREK